MKLIVGLGNPGKIYQGTRHNIGSWVVKTLARECKVSLKKGIFASSLTAKTRIEGKDVMLAVPLVFMNSSGIALSSLIKKYKIEPLSLQQLPKKNSKDYNWCLDSDNLMVVLDDLDLEIGNIRLRPAGSSGGHKGLKSIIEALGTLRFPRLRIGIGRPKAKDVDIARYVLSPFSSKEKRIMQEVIENCCLVLKMWVSSGISKTMNIY